MYGILCVPSGIALFNSIFLINEARSDNVPPRIYFQGLWELVQKRVTWQLCLFLMVVNLFSNFNAGPAFQAASVWANVSAWNYISLAIASSIVWSFAVFSVGRWGLQWNWRWLIGIAVLLSITLEALATLLIIWDRTRNEWIFTALLLFDSIPIALQFTVSFFCGAEISDIGNEGAVYGLLMTIQNIMPPFTNVFNSWLSSCFRADISTDNSHARSQVTTLFAISCSIRKMTTMERVVWPKYCAQMNCSVPLASDGFSFLLMLLLMRRMDILLRQPHLVRGSQQYGLIKYVLAVTLAFLHLSFVVVKYFYHLTITPSDALGAVIHLFIWTTYAAMVAQFPHQADTLSIRLGFIVHAGFALSHAHKISSVATSVSSCIDLATVVVALLVLAPSTQPFVASDGKTSPLDVSSYIGRFVYYWISPFVSLGLRRRFEMEDVPPLPVTDRTASHTFQVALLQERRAASPSFLRLLMRLYGFEVLGFGLWSTCNKLLSLTSPYLIKKFLEWSSNAAPSSSTGFLLAGLICLQAILSAFSGSQFGLVSL
ncbi:hypothetical protein Ae201684P_014895 [Aphanomyces euteiches]|nr:hypothetical protein Ae201684P_014895 [Aphanomyces euteiches]